MYFSWNYNRIDSLIKARFRYHLVHIA
ncbi:protein of unknown function [Methylorubrum extorquens]|uniref:Uncharacterized protein n=1 Tax=Methylorubrum extorquens TaxID=408 RepID=A0A2N9AXH1_METEX|nr:protein of unknown function [Methylorubrum extorquens]